jgi:hypothetical protein
MTIWYSVCGVGITQNAALDEAIAAATDVLLKMHR